MAIQMERKDAPAQVLSETGAVAAGMRVEEPESLLLEMYRWMTFGRAYDGRLISLQRQGRLTTYAPLLGQEAVAVGCGLAMAEGDWLLGTYRDGLAGILRGMPEESIALFFRGHPLAGARPEGVHVFPMQIGIAEQIPHAVGVAWGMKLRKAATATLVLFGDGATSEGAFHEAANFAGVFQAPVVLMCQNNGWAISVPRSRQTHSETLSQKAVAYGIPGRQVDGNDVLAVFREARAALERARSGGGPTLIEALTYRIGPHTTSDDPTRYRPPEEFASWRDTRDPLARLRAYLETAGLWDGARQQELEAETQARVAAAVAAALAVPMPPAESMFENVFAEPTAPLKAQRQEHRSAAGREGASHG
ncbi:MAG TPA: pyruvate dehydrogenase (acetyl-transferring) E1 component subunit alpha [Chloroflexota bacterium]|nr:pyruvate dehydrogenase (acetyl-transferring) E1 component subunit alpha [Chloroflexota bacterium]